MYARYGLPPEVSHAAWRMSIPVYSDASREKQVGYATSGTWSPILKKNIALATIRADYQEIGTELRFETTVEHTRHTVTAMVQKPQFFNPKRKTFTPGSQ